MDEPGAGQRHLKLVGKAPRELDFGAFELRISDYVGGRLAPNDESAFEEALLIHPEWAQWVEAEQLLRDGIRDLGSREPELFAAAVAPRIPAAPAAPTRLPGNPWLGRLALAAAVTFAALLVQAHVQMSRLQDALIGSRAPSAVVEFIRVDDIRGVDNPELTARPAPASGATVVLEIPAGPQPLANYRVRVLRDGLIVLDVADAKADVEGFLRIAVPGSLLPAGSYRAVLADASKDATPVGSYEFTLTR